jgi:diguanylate cyclase (GGDEF)-like protein
MKNNQQRVAILSMGLGPREEQELQVTLGTDYILERFGGGSKGFFSQETNSALLAFVSWRGMNSRLAGLARNHFPLEDFPSRVLVLDAEVSQTDLERIVDAGFTAVVRYPFEPDRIKALVEQAAESQGMYKDLYHMAREICLEREILSRQADLLQFFNKMLTRASFSLDLIEILHQAHEDLRILLNVKSVEAVFWQKNQVLEVEAELFIHEHDGKATQDSLIQYLLEHAAKHAEEKITGYHVNFMSRIESMQQLTAIRDEDMLLLPLRFGGQAFGCICIASEKIARLGRDRLQTILAAVNHLSLALRNALQYREMRTRADRDALTRLPNRHYFDERMLQEMKRHQRYRHPLSLLMMDLDHFKQLNDTHGHQAGDMVLEEIGRILMNRLRSSDTPARYGGEEFVALLANTTEEQAWILAERIREEISSRRFHFKGKFFRVTASIGVASLQTGVLSTAADLLGEADAALYRAKHMGRNTVCSFVEEEEACRQFA